MMFLSRSLRGNIVVCGAVELRRAGMNRFSGRLEYHGRFEAIGCC